MSPEMEEIIQRSLNTIEENLRSEISVEEISDIIEAINKNLTEVKLYAKINGK